MISARGESSGYTAVSLAAFGQRRRKASGARGERHRGFCHTVSRGAQHENPKAECEQGKVCFQNRLLSPGSPRGCPTGKHSKEKTRQQRLLWEKCQTNETNRFTRCCLMSLGLANPNTMELMPVQSGRDAELEH